jgi:hypothetical protein
MVRDPKRRMMLLEAALGRFSAEGILNHQSVATTANIYCRPPESDLRKHLNGAIGEEEEG